MADKFELPESPMEQISRIANHCETKALKGSEKFYQCMRSQQPVRQAEMNVWDPDSESLWHKLKTVWKNRAYDATPEQTIRKGLDPVLREVLPAEEIEEGWHKGKEAIGEIKDGNIMSGAGALGSAVGGTVIKGGYSKTVGKIVPKSWEKKAGEWSDKAEDKASEVTEYVQTSLGLLVYGLGEVKCGSISSYKKKLKAGGGTAEEMNRDHIPNTATMKQKLKLKEGYKRANPKTRKCMENSIKNDAQTLGIPKCFHVAGKTYGNEAKIERGGSLSQIQREDLDHYDALLKDDLSVISTRSPERIQKAEECLKNIDIECKKAIQEGIKEKRKQRPETFMRNVIKKCKDKNKKRTKGNRK